MDLKSDHSRQNHTNSNETKTKNPQKLPEDAVAIVDEILNKAILAQASDIHFEPGLAEMTVKYRLDGVLETVENFPSSFSDSIIARLKVLAQLLTYRNDIPQEGRLDLDTAKDPSKNIIDMRLAVFPTIYGQRAVLRIIYQNEKLMNIGQLGFSKEIMQTLRRISLKNQGLFLVTGSAGSGKSTTLAAILRYILEKFPGKSIVSLEDPVEIRIDGVTQVQISPHGQLTFPTALRSLLRQDPQVLMIGEIRDAQTASIAIEAALTGHLLLSTMHCGTPAAGFLRLLEMGIEPYQVTSSISAILNQRLVRKLCTECKTKNDPEKNDSCLSEYKSVGCPECFGSGFKGRSLIAEIVEMDPQLRNAILSKADLDQLKKIINQKQHQTLLDDANRLIDLGITTTDEVNSACGTYIYE